MPSTNPEQTRWFAEKVQPYEPMLRAYLRGRFPDLADTDDLVQEAYVRLFRARQEGREFEPKSYLFATASNVALDVFRRRRVASIEPVENLEQLSVLGDDADAADSLSRREELALLAEAVQSLPASCRQVLVLQKMHGLSYQEIAERLDISERTVNAQIAKGVLRIRDFMRARRQERSAE